MNKATKKELTRREMWNNMSNHPPHINQIPKEDWLDLSTLIGFDLTYSTYAKSGFTKDYRPSVNRLDPTIGYVVGNLEIVPWWVNNAKGHEYNRKPIHQYSLLGEYIRSWSDKRTAGLLTGVNTNSIGRNARALQRTAGGYQWSYELKDHDLVSEGNTVTVSQLSLTGKLLIVHDSQHAACRYLGKGYQASQRIRQSVAEGSPYLGFLWV